MRIKNLQGMQILDSRGNPTIRVYIELANGITDYTDIPSGMSKGAFEALEIRDNDSNIYNGMGVLTACKNIDTIFALIKDIDVEKQREIDLQIIEYDGTPNKSKLGANAILGVSYACLKASSKLKGIEYYENINNLFNEYFKKNLQVNIPCPLFNLLNGGLHADAGTDAQELIAIPFKYEDIKTLFAGGASKKLLSDVSDPAGIKNKIRIGVEILHTLKINLRNSGFQTGIGDEGGFEPVVKNLKDALNILCESIESAGYKLYEDVSLGIDFASDYDYDPVSKKYMINKKYEGKNAKELDYNELKDYYNYFLRNYPILYIEDFFSENDWNNFTRYTHQPDINRIMFCGDDLVVTNPERLKKAIELGSINTIIVKPNQIGTLYETFQVVNMCLDNNVQYVPSHRSGETNDSIISDIAVGLGSHFIKAGAPERGERTAKYNRLMEISDKLNK